MGFKITIPKGTQFLGGKVALTADTEFEFVASENQMDVAGELANYGEIYGAIVDQLKHETEINGKKFAVTYGAHGVQVIGGPVEEKPKKPKK